MSIVSPEEVKDLYAGSWIDDSNIDDAKLQKWIDTLEAKAEYKLPGFADSVTAGQPPKVVVVEVFANIIFEYVASSNAKVQESQANGEFSRSVGPNERLRRRLDLNEDDILRLSPDANAVDDSAFMVNMAGGRRHPRWESRWYSLAEINRGEWRGENERLLPR